MSDYAAFLGEQDWWNWERRTSAYAGPSRGVEYTEELAGPDGAHLHVWIPSDTPDSQAEKAAAERLKRLDFDIVSWSYGRMPEGETDGVASPPQSRPKADAETCPGETWEPAVREVLRDKSMARVDDVTGERIPDNKSGGMLLDLTTAHVLRTVLDVCNETNRAKLRSLPLHKACLLALKLVS